MRGILRGVTLLLVVILIWALGVVFWPYPALEAARL